MKRYEEAAMIECLNYPSGTHGFISSEDVKIIFVKVNDTYLQPPRPLHTHLHHYRPKFIVNALVKFQ
jgi:hypothetical protein